MGTVITHMTMSLDGSIADPDDLVGDPFDWYQAGDITVEHGNEELGECNLDDASAGVHGDLVATAGALVAGRRLFDIANGWNDSHPTGAKVVVVTHDPPADAAERWPRLDDGHLLLEDPEVVQGRRAVHLRFKVRR